MGKPIRITGGRVVDPANGIDAVRDVCIDAGRIVEQVGDAQTIDARGCIVMAGAIDMHAHLASTTVNAARMIQSASGYETVVPTAPDTGNLYAQMGYTTAIEAAVAPAGAALAHMQLDDLPHLDTGMLINMANRDDLIDALDRGETQLALDTVRHLLAVGGGFGLKAVNPAGVAAWRRDPGKHRIDSMDDCVKGTNVSPRRVLELFTEAADAMKLSHPTHIHGPQLGEPGNVAITLDMLRALDGRRCHLAHLQYYCYAHHKRGGFQSDVAALGEYLRDHREVTFDLGMVAFGPAFTATADLPLEYGLYQHVSMPSKPALFYECEHEDGYGIMPLIHKATNPTHAIQWATGLELALTLDDMTQFALTIDHPNGGSFTNYPQLIAMLMSKARRDEAMSHAHKKARQRTGLGAIEREMTLTDIATITRTAPAKALGLTNKGHLGVGADGDVAIYKDDTNDPQSMFERARWVIKRGEVLIADGNFSGLSASANRLRASV
jgi:formylmethanofuran dehydrogenase subunit A